MSDKYNDIINLPHHVSTRHPQMAMSARSAQFAPFASLTGYDNEVKETERLTSKKIDLDDEEKSILDNKIQIILDQISAKPIVTISYFIKDTKKDGGKYTTITGIVKKIDRYKRIIILEDNSEIPIYDIIDISCDIISMY